MRDTSVNTNNNTKNLGQIQQFDMQKIRSVLIVLILDSICFTSFAHINSHTHAHTHTHTHKDPTHTLFVRNLISKKFTILLGLIEKD